MSDRLTAAEPGALLDVLARLFPDASRTTLRQMLQHSSVRVNGDVEKNARRLIDRGDVVDVAPRSTRDVLHPSLTVLHEDEDVVVIVKPAGLLTVASPGEKEETAQAYLNEYLKAKRAGRIHVVHRIDRDTSGVLVFPKSYEAKERLKEQFAGHDVHRIYVAVVEGVPKQRSGTFRSYLQEGRDLKMRSTGDPHRGTLAVTHYKVVKATGSYAMAEVRLETGKKNQIRVHFADAGHPVVGDRIYGAGDDPIKRLGLHAKELGFRHPRTGKEMKFTAPLPDSFRKLFGGRAG
jgi:23S rRNA pseudouridine1911/1915/1917 synthase